MPTALDALNTATTAESTPPRKRRCRNAKYAQDKKAALCKKLWLALSLGATRAQAAAYAGISRQTLNSWLAVAENEAGSNEAQQEFLASIVEAEARAVVNWLTQIEIAGRRGQWQAAAWKLERRYPQLFGKRTEILDEDGQPVTQLHEHRHTIKIKKSEDPDNIAAVLSVMHDIGFLNAKTLEPALPLPPEADNGTKTENAESTAPAERVESTAD